MNAADSAIDVDDSWLEGLIRAAGVGYGRRRRTHYFGMTRWNGGHHEFGYALRHDQPQVKRTRRIGGGEVSRVPMLPRINMPHKHKVAKENWLPVLVHELMHAVGVKRGTIRSTGGANFMISEERVAEYAALALCTELGWFFPRYYIDRIGEPTAEEQREIDARLAHVKALDYYSTRPHQN